jgi:hypothetical protein
MVQYYRNEVFIASMWLNKFYWLNTIKIPTPNDVNRWVGPFSSIEECYDNSKELNNGSN